VNGGYANASLIKNEAILNGYDDAIVLDAQGHVTEGTVSNIFMVRGGNLITPAAHSDLLEGITRDSIIRIARDLGLSVEERGVDRSELYIADEMFLCGSSARLIPVLSVDKRVVGNGAAGVAGKLTLQLAEKYRAVQLGEDEKYKEWVMEV
jgi:branched-chain amino acid aminotransferase